MDRGTVVITLIGVSASLAGLVLVFVGAILTSLGQFPGDTRRRVTEKYRRAARGMLVLMTVGLAAVVTGTVWMFQGGAGWYHLTAGLSLGQAIGLAFGGWLVAEKVLL
jgi:hypothetical protein